MEKWRNGMIGICLVSMAGSAWADSLDQQRQRYQQIKQAWDSNQMATVDQLLPTLQDYPLYPYLEYRLLAQDLDQETSLAVQNFIQKVPHLAPGTVAENTVCERAGPSSGLARRTEFQSG